MSKSMTIPMPADEWARVWEAATAARLSRAAWVREAITEKLERERDNGE